MFTFEHTNENVKYSTNSQTIRNRHAEAKKNREAQKTIDDAAVDAALLLPKGLAVEERALQETKRALQRQRDTKRALQRQRDTKRALQRQRDQESALGWARLGWAGLGSAGLGLGWARLGSAGLGLGSSIGLEKSLDSCCAAAAAAVLLCSCCCSCCCGWARERTPLLLPKCLIRSA